MKLLGLIRTVTFSFSTLDSLLMLYFALVKSKLEYASASVACNSVTTADSRAHLRKFAALRDNKPFPRCAVPL
jgi:hypothetical protein